MPSAEIDAPCPKCGSGETWASYEDPTAHFCGACRSYYRIHLPAEPDGGCVPCRACGGSQTRGWHRHDTAPIPPDREDADAAE